MELVIMCLGCLAIISGKPWALFSIIFLMCTQSALFGPSKYGIIPELVRKDQLSKANSYLVGLSYLAIIIGTFVPSVLLLNFLDQNFLSLAIVCVIVAVGGLLASWRIQRTPAGGTRKPFTMLFPLELWKTARDISRDRYLFMTVMATAYFLFLGAFIQQTALLYGQDCLGLSWIESGYLFPV